jgi:hypothetical protein
VGINWSIYKGSYNVIKYIILEFIPSTALFDTPSLILGTVSTGIIFAVTYMCIYYLLHIHPPIPFLHLGASPTTTHLWAEPVPPPVLQFCAKKTHKR